MDRDERHRSLSPINETWWWANHEDLKKVSGSFGKPKDVLYVDVVLTFSVIQKPATVMWGLCVLSMCASSSHSFWLLPNCWGCFDNNFHKHFYFSGLCVQSPFYVADCLHEFKVTVINPSFNHNLTVVEGFMYPMFCVFGAPGRVSQRQLVTGQTKSRLLWTT